MSVDEKNKDTLKTSRIKLKCILSQILYCNYIFCTRLTGHDNINLNWTDSEFWQNSRSFVISHKWYHDQLIFLKCLEINVSSQHYYYELKKAGVVCECVRVSQTYYICPKSLECQASKPDICHNYHKNLPNKLISKILNTIFLKVDVENFYKPQIYRILPYLTAEKSRAEFCKFVVYLIFPHQTYKKWSLSMF